MDQQADHSNVDVVQTQRIVSLYSVLTVTLRKKITCIQGIITVDLEEVGAN